jgi:hypothetical protein
MTLLSVSPASGFEEDREHRVEQPGEIRVRFESGDVESRIRVVLVDGRMQQVPDTGDGSGDGGHDAEQHDGATDGHDA